MTGAGKASQRRLLVSASATPADATTDALVSVAVPASYSSRSHIHRRRSDRGPQGMAARWTASYGRGRNLPPVPGSVGKLGDQPFAFLGLSCCHRSLIRATHKLSRSRCHRYRHRRDASANIAPASAFDCGDTDAIELSVMRQLKTTELERQAKEVAALMRMLANEHRLLILCRLVEYGEIAASALADDVGLSPSALSQHLAKLKAEGVVAARRDGQTMWYRIADGRVEELFSTLHRLFCRPRKR